LFFILDDISFINKEGFSTSGILVHKSFLYQLIGKLVVGCFEVFFWGWLRFFLALGRISERGLGRILSWLGYLDERYYWLKIVCWISLIT
jgi:hypothetical protein